MAFSRTTLSLTTVVVILALLGGGIWWRLRSDPEEDPTAEADATEDSPVSVQSSSAQFSTDIPQAVTGAEVVRDTLWISVTATGRAAANREVLITAQTEGYIRALPIRESQEVSRGQLLLQVDTAELALAVEEARADVIDARAKFRAGTLFNDSIPPELRTQREVVLRANTGLNTAEVALRRAELELERARITAPFGGRIGDLTVFESEHVTEGTELMRLVDIDPIKVHVGVLEREIGMLAPGRTARVVFTAFPGEVFEGRIESINPIVDAEASSARVTVVLPNPGGRIKPGMHAEAELEARSYANRVLVPRSAVLPRGEGLERRIVFLFDADSSGSETGTALWQYVTTGQENGEMIEIVPSDEGELEPGQWVLTDGHQYLAHQTRVRLVERVAAAGGRPGG
ncbi:MAG: efflux RND transporter periplasmic adaptor subunit [Longimicrobiales bacterium]|nr:efflux RND transporter periplasmic adaptor subunit [Longimicrobiales bacterium]